MPVLPSTDIAIGDRARPAPLWKWCRRIPLGSAERTGEIPDLERRIDGLLKLRLRDLKLPADIDRLYQDDSRKHRRKMMASWCTWVGWLNLPNAMFDLLILPAGLLPEVLGFRLAITAMFLLASALLRRGLLIGNEHLAILLPCIVMIVFAGTTGLDSPGHALLDHYMAFGLGVICTVILFVRIEQRHSLLLVIVTLLLMFGFYAGSGIEALPEKLQTVTYYTAMLLALQYAKRFHTLYRHQIFLLKKRDELRSSAAILRNDELSSIAYVDPLTGISNRRYFEEIRASIAETTKNLLPLSLCLIDIDHFKNLNDKLGHLQGDRCLRVIATAIRNNLRSQSDILARYGGEEFVILLPRTDEAAALEVLERIRIAVVSLNHPNPGTAAEVVTISAGLAVATSRPVVMETLINAADTALYSAKTSGRNRIRCDSEIF